MRPKSDLPTLLKTICAFVVGGAATLIAGRGIALELGDPAVGKEVFQQCAKCHSIGPASATATAGPSLNGVIGRRSATSGDYNFSPQLRSARLVWDTSALARFLKAPRSLIPGTQMIFKGLTSEKEIADVIAYLAEFDDTGAVKK
jgi:cytochrome c